MHVCIRVHVCRSEDNLREPGLKLRLGGKSLYSLSHLVGPKDSEIVPLVKAFPRLSRRDCFWECHCTDWSVLLLSRLLCHAPILPTSLSASLFCLHILPSDGQTRQTCHRKFPHVLGLLLFLFAAPAIPRPSHCTRWRVILMAFVAIRHHKRSTHTRIPSPRVNFYELWLFVQT